MSSAHPPIFSPSQVPRPSRHQATLDFNVIDGPFRTVH